MQVKAVGRPAILAWVLFFIVLVVVAGWVAWSVLVRARHMRTADTPAVAISAMPPGQSAKAVVLLNRVDHAKLSGTLLQRESDTVYQRSAGQASSQVDALLTPYTAVVMGRPQDITAGAVVQVAGNLDGSHVLHTKQVVILTGCVRVEEENGKP